MRTSVLLLGTCSLALFVAMLLLSVLVHSWCTAGSSTVVLFLFGVVHWSWCTVGAQPPMALTHGDRQLCKVDVVPWSITSQLLLTSLKICMPGLDDDLVVDYCVLGR